MNSKLQMDFYFNKNEKTQNTWNFIFELFQPYVLNFKKKTYSNKKKCRIRGFQYISFPMISILESYIPLNTLWLLYLSPDIIALSNSFTNFSHKLFTSCLDFKKNLLFCNPPQKIMEPEMKFYLCVTFVIIIKNIVLKVIIFFLKSPLLPSKFIGKRKMAL